MGVGIERSLADRISDLLAYFRNMTVHFEVFCDAEGIRIYLPDGLDLDTYNEIAAILHESIGVEPVELTLHKADDDMICLAFYDKEEDDEE